MTHHSPSYAITARLRYRDQPGLLGKITTAIGDSNGFIGAVDIVGVSDGLISRDITVNATNVEHGQRIVEAIRQIAGIEVVNVSDRVFLMHLGGKIEVKPKMPIKTRDDRGAGLYGDPRRSRIVVCLDDSQEHRRRRQ